MDMIQYRNKLVYVGAMLMAKYIARHPLNRGLTCKAQQCSNNGSALMNCHRGKFAPSRLEVRCCYLYLALRPV